VEAAKESFLSRLLDPLDRLVESIYSVLIVLTFTLAYRVADAQGVLANETISQLMRNLFWASFGCAVAWGLIDGVMYVLTSVFERGQEARLLRLVRGAPTPEAGEAVIAEQLDDSLGQIMTEEERAALSRSLYDRLRDNEPQPGGFRREDWAGALGVALVAVLAALPVVLPLLILSPWPATAIRVSNLVAFVSLYALGYGWGKYAGGKPHRVGLLLLVVGVLMVVVAIPLGG
jgi:hypothetical protein